MIQSLSYDEFKTVTNPKKLFIERSFTKDHLFHYAGIGESFWRSWLGKWTGPRRLVQFWQNFQTSLVLLIPNCTENRMITYTNLTCEIIYDNFTCENYRFSNNHYTCENYRFSNNYYFSC